MGDEGSKKDEEDSATIGAAEQEESDQIGEESKKPEPQNGEQQLGDQAEKDDDGTNKESTAIADDAITDGEKQEPEQENKLDLQQDQSEVAEEKSEGI